MADSILYRQLRAYLDRDLLPMHMPGHKRHLKNETGLPYEWDLTEVEGTDDLHHPEGILAQAMDRTARLFGAGRTFYLVNGSTCGILASVRASLPRGGTILAAENCHRSVFHAIELCDLKIRWLKAPEVPGWGICGSIKPGDVREMLQSFPDIGAVILTSPTYEGVVSDIASIGEICHEYGLPLIVDEAHGAHLGLVPDAGFPDSALHLGADLVVQSPHKTLGSLTQTALLHLNSERVSEAEIRRQLDIFETSSPSYPLMVSLDACTCSLLEEGEEILGAWKRRLDVFRKMTENLEKIRLLTGKEEGIFACDRSKILMDFSPLGLSGPRASRILREKYRIETEMSQGTVVLAMTGACDREDALEILGRALEEMDRLPGAECPKAPARKTEKETRQPVRITDGLERPGVPVPLNRAAGRICAEYVYCYPPGIPLLVPGEKIRQEVLDRILELRENSAPLHGSREEGLGESLLVLT